MLKNSLLISLAVICSISLSSTATTIEPLISTAPLGKFGGSLRLTQLGGDPKTLNPWISSDHSSSTYGALLFDGLTSKDPDTNEVIPFMAKSFRLEDAGKRIIVTLRKGLKWSDGQEITTSDVSFTWNTLLKDQIALSSLRDVLLVDGEFPEVTVLDRYTIKFQTKEIFAPFLENLQTAIAPEHHVREFIQAHNQSLDNYSCPSEACKKKLQKLQSTFNQYLNVNTQPAEIVSSGAFLLQSIHHGERIEFKRNPNYFIENTQGKTLPYVDKLIYSYINDQSADVFKFLAKESHQLSVSPATAALIKSLEKKYGYKLYDLGPSSGTNFLWFNLSSNVPEPQYTWFNDENFRRAISYVIDRDSMVANVFQGLAAPLFSAESLRSPYANRKLGHKRNLEYANQILEKSGFQNKDGVLYDTKKNKVEFDLFTNSGNKERELMASIVANNLSEIGIQVNFKALEFNNFVGRIMAGTNYQAAIIGLTGGNEPNGGANVWRSNGRLHMFDIHNQENTNQVRDWEKEIDRLFNAGVQTMDQAARKQIYDEFQEIVYQHKPLIYLVSPNLLVAISDKVGNSRKTEYGSDLIPWMHDAYLHE